jgi:nucleoside-diphosphate-sugar epimerase
MPDGRRIAVTGAAGFIGGALVEALDRAGHRTIALTRRGGRPAPAAAADEVAVEITDAREVRRALVETSPDAVVHAAMVPTHPVTDAEVEDSLRVSVLGTAAVLAGAGAAGVGHVVHVGSSLEYGPYDRPILEDDALRPTTPRGAHKGAAAILALEAGGRRTGVTVVRPFSVYGPREPEGRLVPTAIRAALDGTPLPLTAHGVRRDLVHVDDVVDGVIRVLDARERVFGGVFNLGSGTDLDNHEIVAAVGRAVGRPIAVVVGAHEGRPPDTPRWIADATRAQTVLGWSARSFEAGLVDAAAWPSRLESVGA